MTGAMIYLTVLMTGLGCGLGCGSVSTPFLVARMVGEQRSKKECVQAALLFLLGKLVMLALLGFLSSLVGKRILDSLQALYPGVTKWIFRGVLAAAAGMIFYHTLQKKDCGHCKSCGHTWNRRLMTASYPVAGAVYAAIPCAPLVYALTNAAAMMPFNAVLLLLCFGIANSVIPVLLYAPFTGVIVKKIWEEVPQFMKKIQLAAAIILLGLMWTV